MINCEDRNYFMENMGYKSKHWNYLIKLTLKHEKHIYPL